MSAGRSPLSAVFLLHIALEVPLAIQGVFSPTGLPFVQLNNTTIAILKLYSALTLSLCVVAFLAYGLPGAFSISFLSIWTNRTRALAIGLCIYHTACSTILYNAPRFIPMSLGPMAEGFNIWPERVWGTMHGFLGVGMVIWWQGTLQYAQLAQQPGAAR
ncbi:hypothetical protein HMN09_00243800 [Mycena chlorophos]|uniref:Integral membrane protein n=1 Tax=Mycena chlorophos TaxID=658473 RepID=A0A8H6TNU2_MYCCL|nr:hypothetical protein HMN09_00243800 [Mycena chlorophos]